MNKKKNKPAKLTMDVIKSLQDAMNDCIRNTPKEKKKGGKNKKSKKEKSSNRSS